MTSKRRILFAVTALTLTMASAHAAVPEEKQSITKVGNADEGSDLEGAEPITSGPIWETRGEAAALVKALNIRSIPHLSIVLPEIEKTELLMAKADVAATSPTSALEVSENGKTVYARTFAEPHAATRFFPAALGLDRNQLKALHVHEALHRSLPPDVRENESVVTELTLAITSPDANYDRVSRVASVYLEPAQSPSAAAPATTSVAKVEALPEKDAKPTRFFYELHQHPGYVSVWNNSSSLHGLGFEMSPFGVLSVRGRYVEPSLTVKGYYFRADGDSYLGPIDMKGRVAISEESADEIRSSYGFLVERTLKSLDDLGYQGDRDIQSFGAYVDRSSSRSYGEASFLYTLESTVGPGVERFGSDKQFNSNSYEYGRIVTLSGKTGLKLGKFRTGLLADLHVSEGIDVKYGGRNSGYTEIRQERFHVFTAGPEIAFKTGRFAFDLTAKMVMGGNLRENLGNLGDLTNRGTGRGQINTSLSIDL